jgi:hypothetical protein
VKGQPRQGLDARTGRSQTQRDEAARDAFRDEVFFVTRFRLAGFFDARRLRPAALGSATLEELPTLGRPRRGALVSFSRARRCSLHRSFTKFRAPARMVMVDASGLPH